MSLRVHERAVSAALEAAGGWSPVDEPLVELVRTLARQTDDAGPQPRSRFVGSYLTALRTLLARLGPAIDRGDSPLARLRAERLKSEHTARKRV